MGLGTLFISENNLCWQEKDNIGFCIDYRNISLHAISKDENVYSRECIYIMVDGRIYMPGDEPQHLNDDNDEDVESEPEISELLLVPDEENSPSVLTIYEAIKICQELNPDPDDMDEEDEEDDLYADAEDEMEEGHYVIHDRADGDADINELSRRLEGNTVDINYIQNGNEEDEFQDAD